MEKHIVLIGDSIIDNQPYVEAGQAVTERLVAKLPTEMTVTRLATDGHTTRGALEQLERLPTDATDIVISVGGNDALGYAPALEQPSESIGHAFEQFARLLESFKQDYTAVINRALSSDKPVTLMTIYNAVPGLGRAEQTALALFNEVILEIGIGYGLKIIDLRQLCGDETDYSTVSPIEPSATGSEKISDAIITCLGIPHQTQYCRYRAIAFS